MRRYSEPLSGRAAFWWSCGWKRVAFPCFLRAQDAICGAVDSDAPGGPTVMDARSFQLSEFLADFLPSVSDDALLMGQLGFCTGCLFPQPPTLTETPAVFSAWDGRRDAPAVHQQGMSCPVPKLVVVATAVGKDHLHESLRTPALFGGDAVHLKSAKGEWALPSAEAFRNTKSLEVRNSENKCLSVQSCQLSATWPASHVLRGQRREPAYSLLDTCLDRVVDDIAVLRMTAVNRVR